MDEELHDEALARGLIRYCPICDGYEVTDKKVGVIGSDSRGVAEAIFLRSFTADVTLIAPDKALEPQTPRTSKRLKAAGIDCVDGPAQAVAIDRRSASSSTRPRATTPSTASIRRLGSDTHTQLAEMLGARLSADGCIGVDAHQRTSVAGPLRRGRRGDRPRPDQPCDGRRRRRGDDDPQRSARRSPR